MSRFANVGMLPAGMREQVEAKLAEQTRTVQLLGPSGKPGRKHANGPRKPAYTLGKLLWQIQAHKLPAAVIEHKFHATRKWRFDLAWPAAKIACEIEGLTHDGGRHQRVAGYTEDCRKYLAALLDGWRVVRITPGMVRSGEGARALVALLSHGGA